MGGLEMTLIIIKKTIFLLLFAFFLIVGFFVGSFVKTRVFYSQPKEIGKEDLVSLLVERMTLEEKVGQLFMVGFNGQSLSQEDFDFFQKNHFSNFLLLGRNIKDKEQVRRLTALLEKLSFLPCLIAIDQEGGEVARFSFGPFADLSQAEITEESQAFQTGKKRGQFLKELGVNLNFSPVLEVVWDKNSYINFNKRAFLGNERQVYLLGKSIIEGYQKGRIISCPKHFPGGLGRLSVDPHQSLPVLLVTPQEVEKDLFPFRKLIEEDKLKMIMVTHLLLPKLDSRFPASLSSKIIKEILRDELGFKGVVVTDDLVMGAVSDNFSVEQASLQAFLAEADLFIVSFPLEKQEAAKQALLQKIKGENLYSRLDQSVERIVRLKLSL